MCFKLAAKIFILILITCLCTNSFYSQNRHSSDSLKNLIKSVKNDSIKIYCLYHLANLYEQNNPDSTEYFLKEAVKEAKKGSNDYMIIQSQINIGTYYSNKGIYEKAFESFRAGLSLSEKLGDVEEIAFCNMYIGEIYMYQSNYPKSLDLLQSAVKTFEAIDKTRDEHRLKKGIVNSYNNIGTIHAENGNFKQANDYFKKALAVEEKNGDKLVIAGCNNNIGNVYYMQGDYSSAIDYYKKALKIAEELQDKSSMSERYNNLGVVYTEINKYGEAIDYYEKSFDIDKELGDLKGMSLVSGNIALLKIYQKKYNEAILYAEQSISIAKKIGALDEEKCAYEYLATTYDSLKNFEQACKYLKLFKLMNDSIFNIESARQVKEMEAVYQTEKNQKEIELLNKDKELQQIEISKQEMLKYSFFIGFALMLILSFVVYMNYSQKKKANIILTEQKKQIEEKNEVLNQQNEEISAQRDEIESQRDIVTYQKDKIEEIHNQLTSSIYYAKRIQNAVLPNKEFLDKTLKDYFVYFKPRDIVSGDFFWINVRKNYLLIAVADCTGHGVPGAFISMLGISFLNDIVARDDITQADHVLNTLREYVLKSLQQKGSEGEHKDITFSDSSSVKDGMDISFVCINTEPVYTESGIEKYKVQFAGANNSLYLVTGEASQQPATSNQQLIELKGDKMPISIYRNMNEFTNHEFTLQKGDTIYLSTDGFCDQYGGPDDRKFLSRNFRKLLFNISANPMNKQKGILSDTLASWMNNKGKTYEQTDDITVMGIRL